MRPDHAYYSIISGGAAHNRRVWTAAAFHVHRVCQSDTINTVPTGILHTLHFTRKDTHDEEST